MPEGARESEDEDQQLDVTDPHAALANINLDEPLRPEESLPVPSHRTLKLRADAKTADISSPEPDVDDVVAQVKAEQKKQGKEEKRSKKKKRDKKAEDDSLVDVIGAVSEEPKPKKKSKKKVEVVEAAQPPSGEAQGPDIDFWLLGGSGGSR